MAPSCGPSQLKSCVITRICGRYNVKQVGAGKVRRIRSRRSFVGDDVVGRPARESR